MGGFYDARNQRIEAYAYERPIAVRDTILVVS
jgi:hypothetical protein